MKPSQFRDQEQNIQTNTNTAFSPNGSSTREPKISPSKRINKFVFPTEVIPMTSEDDTEIDTIRETEAKGHNNHPGQDLFKELEKIKAASIKLPSISHASSPSPLVDRVNKKYRRDICKKNQNWNLRITKKDLEEKLREADRNMRNEYLYSAGKNKKVYLNSSLCNPLALLQEEEADILKSKSSLDDLMLETEDTKSQSNADSTDHLKSFYNMCKHFSKIKIGAVGGPENKKVLMIDPLKPNRKIHKSPQLHSLNNSYQISKNVHNVSVNLPLLNKFHTNNILPLPMGMHRQSTQNKKNSSPYISSPISKNNSHSSNKARAHTMPSKKPHPNTLPTSPKNRNFCLRENHLTKTGTKKKTNGSPRIVSRTHAHSEARTININSYGLGDKYAEALSVALENTKLPPKVVNVSQNRLTNKGATAILNSLPETLNRLSLTSNQLTSQSYRTISELLSDPYRCLTRLNLENNRGGDEGVRILCNSLIKNKTLTELNLSKNNITDIGAAWIGELLDDNFTLVCLILHWNLILSDGGEKVCSGMFYNKGLQILDLSFNALGKKNSKSAVALSKMFDINRTLIHIDLSMCELKACDIKTISQGLKNNRKLLGIHLLGNEGIVDSLGFVNPITSPRGLTGNQQNNPGKSHLFCRIPKTLETGGRSRNHKMRKMQAFSNCWICEGWTQVEFQMKVNKETIQNYNSGDPVFICFNFEDFSPDLMEEDPQKKNLYRITRMVPPGKLKYCFLTNETIFTSKSKPIGKMENNCITGPSFYQGVEGISIPKTNIIHNIIETKHLLTEEKIKAMKSLPRPKPRPIQLKERPKTPWDFNKSVFKSYIPDNEKLLAKCFEFDWNCSKITKFVKEESEQFNVKTALKNNYKIIRELYKLFAGVEPTNNVFSISNNVMTDISNQMNVIDPNTLKLSDFDLEFVSTTAGIKNQKFNPERALVRYQLMEIILRLSIRKFCYSGAVSNPSKAIQKMFDDHLIPFFGTIEAHKWRRKFLWTEECDIVYKKHNQTLKKLYHNYSGSFCLPGQTRFMTFIELNKLAQDADIMDENLGSREINICFNLSMMTQVDEINNDRHLHMNQTEFIEALGRIADRYYNALNLTLAEKIGNLLELVKTRVLDKNAPSVEPTPRDDPLQTLRTKELQIPSLDKSGPTSSRRNSRRNSLLPNQNSNDTRRKSFLAMFEGPDPLKQLQDSRNLDNIKSNPSTFLNTPKSSVSHASSSHSESESKNQIPQQIPPLQQN